MSRRITTAQGRAVTVADDYTVAQRWDAYTPEEHDRWDRLYAQQRQVLRDRACNEFLSGLDLLKLSEQGIPRFDRLSTRLQALTGWTVVAVPDLVPHGVFFEHLAHRRFPAGDFIRREDQLDYIQEPDVFHDVFGHVPMLAHPVFADYAQAYGRGGLKALERGMVDHLARLYWYTVEFGLVRSAEGVRIYGSGIVSSKAESVFALESPSPNRLRFDLERMLRTTFRIDDYQQTYWVIDDFDELLEATAKNFDPIYDSLQADGMEYRPYDVLAQDRPLHLGTQERPYRSQKTTP